MRTLRRILIVLAVILLISSGGFVAWASSAALPAAEAEQALVSDDQAQVSQERWLVFQPVGKSAETGLVFYPGG